MFFEISFINYKFTSLKLGTILFFLHIQSTQTLKVDNHCFFLVFFSTKFAIPFENWRGFDIDDLNYLIS